MAPLMIMLFRAAIVVTKWGLVEVSVGISEKRKISNVHLQLALIGIWHPLAMKLETIRT